jgi:acetoin utilization protein AcuB
MQVRPEYARVRGLMRRRFMTLRPEDTLLEADRLMRMARVRALPVVEDGRLEGTLCHRALVHAALAETLEGARDAAAAARFLRDTCVSELMDRMPAVVTPETALPDAVARLVEREEGCLPVVDGGGEAPRLVAILTESDLLRAAYASGRRPN